MNKKNGLVSGDMMQKQQFDTKTLRRLLSYMKDYKGQLIFVVVCILLSAIASAVSALFLQSLIDDYIAPLLTSSAPVFTQLLNVLVVIGAVYLIGVLATLFYNRVMVTIAQGTLKKIRDEMFEKMQRLPIRAFDTRTDGDIMSLYTNDTDTLRQMISQSIPQLISSVITIISVLVSMIILNVPLTIVTLFMVGVMLVASKNLAGLSGKYFMEQQKNLGIVNGYIEEMMEGQKVVKVFCHEEESLSKFNELNDQLFESANNANKFANVLMPTCAQIGNISYVLCAIVGGVLAVNGISGFTLGGLASFLTFNKSFSQPINQVSQQFNSIVMALAGAKRIFDLLDEKPEVDEGYVTLVNVKEENGKLVESQKRTGRWAWKHYHKATGTTDYVELKGDIVLDGVDFGYRDDKIVLHDVRMYAKPGQKIAFVGSTGAGKTTVTNLLNRFYDIQDGKIRYDGININKIKKGDLRRSMGIVLQDTNLFTTTVMENIRYGKLDATDEEVIAAARLANADGFIRRLPDGYQTMLRNNGANLSQGQRQLLAIARAAVANPPALILDEATSSIDTRTEIKIQEAFSRMMQGRTSFIVAHRLSTIQEADVILVMKDGHIIEQGNHESLLAKNGFYAKLYNSQFAL